MSFLETFMFHQQRHILPFHLQSPVINLKCMCACVCVCVMRECDKGKHELTSPKRELPDVPRPLPISILRESNSALSSITCSLLSCVETKI